MRTREKVKQMDLESTPLMNSDDLAAFLGISRHTLDQWVYFGTGPPHYKVGRHRRYSREDIDRWLQEQRRS